MRPDRLVDAALRCYPAWWQERYAGEVRTVSDDLRAAGRGSLRIVLDLLAGMVRVRRDGVGMPRTYPLWNARTRASVTVATLPFVLLAPLVVATFEFAGLRSGRMTVLYSGFSLFPHHLFHVVGGREVAAPPLTPGATVISWAELTALVIVLASLATALCGWSSLVGAVRAAPSGRRRGMRLLAWSPAIVVLAFVSLTVAAAQIGPRGWESSGGRPMVPIGGNVALGHAVELVAQAVLVGGWLLSALAIAVVARRVEMTPSALRAGAQISAAFAVLTVLLAAAFAAWGAGVVLQAHQAGSGHFTVFVFGRTSLWPVSTAAAAVVAYLSVTAALRARRGSRIVAELAG